MEASLSRSFCRFQSNPTSVSEALPLPRVPTRIVQSDLDPGHPLIPPPTHIPSPRIFFIHRTEKEKQQNSNRFGLQWQPEGLRSGHPVARLSDVRVSVPARFRGLPPMTTRPLRCMLYASAGNVGMGGTSQVITKTLSHHLSPTLHRTHLVSTPIRLSCSKSR